MCYTDWFSLAVMVYAKPQFVLSCQSLCCEDVSITMMQGDNGNIKVTLLGVVSKVNT